MLRRRPFGLYNLVILSSMPHRRHASCYVVDHQWSQQMWNWSQRKLWDSHFKEENDTHLMHIPCTHPNTAPSVVNSMRHKYIEIVTVVNMFNVHETPIYRDRNSGPIHSMLTFQNNSKTCLKDQMMLVYASLNIVVYIQNNPTFS